MKSLTGIICSCVTRILKLRQTNYGIQLSSVCVLSPYVIMMRKMFSGSRNPEYNLLTPLRNQGRFDVPAALIIYAYQLIPCFASN